jgi:hypothetical protein
MNIRVLVCAAVAPLLLGACAANSFGPQALRTPSDVQIFDHTSQTADAYAQADNPNIAKLDSVDPNSPAYVADGYSRVYKLCNDYFDELVLAQNKMGFASDAVATGGATTATIMGLAKASAQQIALVAAGTGLVSSLIQSYDNRALMTPYPSETKTLILAALDEYEKAAPPESATTKMQAVSLVQHYAEICTYSGITRFAKEAITTSSVSTSTPTPTGTELTVRPRLYTPAPHIVVNSANR